MAKKNNRSKEVELIHRLWLENPKFRDWVATMREHLNIAPDGLKGHKKAIDWQKLNATNYMALVYQGTDFATEYNFPSRSGFLIADYVINNLDTSLFSWEQMPAHIIGGNESTLRYTEEVKLKEAKVPFVKMVIYGHATEHTLVNFIKKHYKKEIEPILGLDRKRIRKTVSPPRDRDVLKLAKLGVVELRKKAKMEKGEKDEAIANLLKKKYPGITSSIVKKTIGKIKI
jgi:hypothetical protein